VLEPVVDHEYVYRLQYPMQQSKETLK